MSEVRPFYFCDKFSFQDGVSLSLSYTSTTYFLPSDRPLVCGKNKNMRLTEHEDVITTIQSFSNSRDIMSRSHTSVSAYHTPDPFLI